MEQVDQGTGAAAPGAGKQRGSQAGGDAAAAGVATVSGTVAPPLAHAPGGEPLDLYDIALLHGGPQLAVSVALVALDVASAIRCGEELVHELVDAGAVTYADLRTDPRMDFDPGFAITARRRPSPAAHPIELALYEVVIAAPPTATVQSIREEGMAAPAVEAATGRLTQLGLSRPRDAPPLSVRTSMVVVALVLGISLVVMLGSPARIPWFGLVVPILLVLFVIVSLGLAPRLGADRPARKAVNEARSVHPRPRVERKAPPLGRVHDLCPLIAVHGEMILWDLDPALALALSFPRARDAGFWSFVSDLDFGGCDGCGCD